RASVSASPTPPASTTSHCPATRICSAGSSPTSAGSARTAVSPHRELLDHHRRLHGRAERGGTGVISALCGRRRWRRPRWASPPGTSWLDLGFYAVRSQHALRLRED